jgi:hypothetical protein
MRIHYISWYYPGFWFDLLFKVTEVKLWNFYYVLQLLNNSADLHQIFIIDKSKKWYISHITVPRFVIWLACTCTSHCDSGLQTACPLPLPSTLPDNELLKTCNIRQFFTPSVMHVLLIQTLPNLCTTCGGRSSPMTTLTICTTCGARHGW